MVPREAMSIIFECCLFPFAPETFRDELRLRLGYRNPIAPPLVLSRVCRSWRDLALSLPKLWSNIEVYITQGPYMGISAFACSAKKQTDMVTHWVKHSKSHQLDCKVKIEASQNALLACQNTIRRLLDLLAAQSNRWRSMTLRFPSYNIPISTILESIRGDLTYVRFLKIDREMESLPMLLVDNSPMLLGNAPMLAGLHLHHIRLSESVVPWTQLTDLSMDQPIDYTIGVISNCKNLEKLSLTVSFSGQLIDNALITLSKLQILSVRGNLTALNSLLASFTVPQLHMFSASAPGYASEIAQLAPFLQRLSYPLDALEIDISNVDLVILVGWLQLVPSLRALSFGTRCVLTHEICHSLAPNEDKEFICPSLTHLRARFRCSLSSLADMMEKRWFLRPSPKTLVIDIMSRFNGEDGERFVSRDAIISRFKLLRNKGLELRGRVGGVAL